MAISLDKLRYGAKVIAFVIIYTREFYYDAIVCATVKQSIMILHCRYVQSSPKCQHRGLVHECAFIRLLKICNKMQNSSVKHESKIPFLRLHHFRTDMVKNKCTYLQP